MKISAVIPSFNPTVPLLTEVINSVISQSLPSECWELILVDNCSQPSISSLLGSDILSSLSLIEEPRPGLTRARIAGIQSAKNDLVVFIDDDNILDYKYFEESIAFFKNHPQVSIAGGKILPRYEVPIKPWQEEFSTNLAIRDLGNEIIICDAEYDDHFRLQYPKAAPVGAGMVLRKESASEYVKYIEKNDTFVSDRIGTNLSSSGDNEIVISTLTSSKSVAYLPQLSLTHVIPESRLSSRYLSELRFSLGRSWVKLLFKHAASPWAPMSKPQLPVSLMRSFIKEKAWANTSNFIRWRYFAGHLYGRADFSKYSKLNRTLRDLTLGKIVFNYFHRPKKYLIQLASKRLAADETPMKSSVHRLKLKSTDSSSSFKVFFLSGSKFWEQTCYCFVSLQNNTELSLQPYVIDDGTFRVSHIRAIKRCIPHAIVIENWEIEARLDKFLPASEFPSLRARRLEYPQLKKLTDIHVGLCGWKLVLDSDMLFYKEPVLMLNWLQNPSQACHMVDSETSYGYSPQLMKDLSGCHIPEKINVGVTGLNSEDLDWKTIESWSQRMIEEEGTHYFQEQALIAMLMARMHPLVLPPDDYICMPTYDQVQSQLGVLHHYVADSKKYYFNEAWRSIL